MLVQISLDVTLIGYQGKRDFSGRRLVRFAERLNRGDGLPSTASFENKEAVLTTICYPNVWRTGFQGIFHSLSVDCLGKRHVFVLAFDDYQHVVFVIEQFDVRPYVRPGRVALPLVCILQTKFAGHPSLGMNQPVQHALTNQLLGRRWHLLVSNQTVELVSSCVLRLGTVVRRQKIARV